MNKDEKTGLIEQFEPDTEQAILAAVERLLRMGYGWDEIYHEMEIHNDHD